MVSYPFQSPNGQVLQITPNSTLIPNGFAPVNPGSYKIKMGDSKSLSTTFTTLQAGQPVNNPYKNFLVSVGSPAPVAPPPNPQPPQDPQPAQTSTVSNSVVNPDTNQAPPVVKPTYSTGANYISTSGATLYLASGTVVPDGWVLETNQTAPTDDPTIVPFVNSAGTVLNVKVASTVIPPGYKPQNPGSYQYKTWDRMQYSFGIFTVNEQVAPSDPQPNGPCYLISYTYSSVPNQQVKDLPISEKDVIDTAAIVDAGTINQNIDDGNAKRNAGTKPSLPPSTINWTLVGSIIGVVGVAGVSYIGYLYITNPTGFRHYAENLHSLIGIGIDIGYFMILCAIIAGISFIGYEFFNAYNQTGSVSGAIGLLTADTIEVLVSAIVDAVEVLVSDAWNFAWGEIQSVVPSWL